VRGQDAASTLRPHIETCLQGRQLSFQTRVPAPPPLPPYMFNADTDQEEEMQATLIPDVEASTGTSPRACRAVVLCVPRVWCGVVPCMLCCVWSCASCG
jgi:hypothetical protein